MDGWVLTVVGALVFLYCVCLFRRGDGWIHLLLFIVSFFDFRYTVGTTCYSSKRTTYTYIPVIILCKNDSQ